MGLHSSAPDGTNAAGSDAIRDRLEALLPDHPDRPERHNALSMQLSEELAGALELARPHRGRECPRRWWAFAWRAPSDRR
jgi:hypothetical protein